LAAPAFGERAREPPALVQPARLELAKLAVTLAMSRRLGVPSLSAPHTFRQQVFLLAAAIWTTLAGLSETNAPTTARASTT
jgi:hypothetical protein